MDQHVEEGLESLTDARHLVSVQPEVSEGRVDRFQHFRLDVDERTVVQVETDRREARERSRQQVKLPVTVEEQVLEVETAEGVLGYGPESVVTEVEPLESGQVRESSDLDVFQTAFAQVQMTQSVVPGEVGSPENGGHEGVGVEVQLETIGGYPAWNEWKTTPAAVDDSAEDVAETSGRAIERGCPRQKGRAAEQEHHQGQPENQQYSG